MGIVVGKTTAPSSEEDNKRHKDIESRLRKDRAAEERTLKLLLLGFKVLKGKNMTHCGAAESGKSTFAKQMRILHQNGFTMDERMNFRHIIHTFILHTIVDIIDTVQTAQLTDMIIKYDQIQDIQKEMNKLIIYKEAVNKEHLDLNKEVAELIRMLWNKPVIQECVKRGSHFNLPDALLYFIGKLDDVSQSDYIPSNQDILHVRLRTMGVIETSFSCKGYCIRLLDVGGQRSERRKWIHCFDNVTAIIFTAAISEYDQMLAEDTSVNRMHESITLFTSICNNPHFLRTSMILFLNKKDLFEVKIQSVPLTVAFPSYRGDNSYESTTTYIRHCYESVKQVKEKEIYTHLTNATDTKNINFVFDAMMSVVMKQNLETAGMF